MSLQGQGKQKREKVTWQKMSLVQREGRTRHQTNPAKIKQKYHQKCAGLLAPINSHKYLSYLSLYE